MICLDNDVLRKYARPSPDQQVVQHLSNHQKEPWTIPAIVLFEHLHGYSSQNRLQTQRQRLERTMDAVLPLDADVAQEAAEMAILLSNSNTSLSIPDLLVAATARSHTCTLKTANKNDFDETPIHQLMAVDIVPTT
jgi:predicted nucleic acid-binding protein